MMKSISIITFCLLMFGSNLYAQWERMNNSSVTTRHHPVTFTLNNTAYLISGTTAQSSPLGTKSFFQYDEENDSWIQLEDFPGPARSFAYAATYNGKAYFGFGSQQQYFNDLWEFDPDTGEWTELTSCSCIGRSHPVFVAYDGKIYVGLGGNFNDLNDWWMYNIENDEWTELDPLPGNPRHHPFHFAAGGYIYAGFGHSGPNYYADWYRYDPVAHEWTRMQDHPNGPRVAGQEFAYGGYGFVISGDGQNHFNLQDGEFYKYDHHSDNWIRLPDHPGSPPDGRIGRWAPGSFVLNDYVYFFGGVNRGGSFLYNEVWRFDLKDVVSNTISLEKKKHLDVFPNPSTGIINLTNSDSDFIRGKQLQVYDVLGKKVHRINEIGSTIDLSFLRPGNYFLQLSSSDENYQTIPISIIE